MGMRTGILGFAAVLVACSASSSGNPGGSGGSGGSSGSGGSGALSVGCDTTDPTDCVCGHTNDPSKVTPNATCTPDSVGGGVCCADIGYPNTDLSICQCVTWGCFNSASTCTCGPSSGTDPSCTGGFAHCCVQTAELASPFGCHCSNFACASDETEVDHCGSDMAGCVGSNQQHIDRCTL